VRAIMETSLKTLGTALARGGSGLAEEMEK
jgi:hypothetical protein